MLFAKRVACVRTMLLAVRESVTCSCEIWNTGRKPFSSDSSQVLDELGIRMELEVPDDARERVTQLLSQLPSQVKLGHNK